MRVRADLHREVAAMSVSPICGTRECWLAAYIYSGLYKTASTVANLEAWSVMLEYTRDKVDGIQYILEECILHPQCTADGNE